MLTPTKAVSHKKFSLYIKGLMLEPNVREAITMNPANAITALLIVIFLPPYCYIFYI
jgi:hypothetical protein